MGAILLVMRVCGMSRGRHLAVMIVACWTAAFCSSHAPGAEPGRESQLPAPFKRLIPLYTPLGKPQPGDWLSMHNEPGQTFREYLRSNPIRPDHNRKVIYIQPLGDFSRAQRRIVDQTGTFLGLYFNLPVQIREGLPLARIPNEARRKHPTWGMDQILTSYVLYDVLIPRLPQDAVAMLALTTSDLWPGEGWNFVFGQATIADRVGVWSLYRFGDPAKDDAAYKLCLRRMLKTASHETGHMFSMLHCTAYECNMCGSNHLAEADRRPLALCPQCMAKVCWLTKADTPKYLERLAAFCRENGFEAEAAFYRRSLDVIAGQSNPRAGTKPAD